MKCAAVVIVENKLGQILLCQRGPISRDEIGKWENPGGEIDPGETPEVAIKREIIEELGSEIIIKNKLFEQRNSGWCVTVFWGELKSKPKLMNSAETCQFKWFPKSDLPNINLASYTRADFAKLGWL